MINNIKLKFGPSPNSSGESIALSPVTVFVGPNNSGKSMVLAELYRRCQSGERFATELILDTLEFAGFSEQQAEEQVGGVAIPAGPTDNLRPGQLLLSGVRGGSQSRTIADREALLRTMRDPQADPAYFCGCYLGYKTLKLDGSNRITLLATQKAGRPSATEPFEFSGSFQGR